MVIKMRWRDRPWLLYIMILVTFIGAGILYRIHEDFGIDISIELLGALLTIFIIDSLLLRSKRKRWDIVKDEVEYILARTVNNIRDEILIEMFAFKPSMSSCSDKSLKSIEDSIREQRDKRFKEIIQMDEDELFKNVEDNFLKKGYQDQFSDSAEELWRMINTRYSEHIDPEIADDFLKLHLYLRDLHSSILLYKRENKGTGSKRYYYKKGKKGIKYNIKECVKVLIRLKRRGYSAVPTHR